MRTFLLSLTLTIALILSAACGSSEQANTSAGNSAPTQPANARTSTTTAQPASDGPPVATSHGTPPASSGAGGPDGGPANPALDAKIEQAEARAKAAGATPADKQAAAAAYLERANIFYAAGNPSLYKFALRDFRRTLKYDPTNEEARAKRDQIVDIYTNSVRRPVPDLGNEP
jgi:hypothetical protein